MDKLTITPRSQQGRARRYLGYAIGVLIESTAVCVIMLVAFVIAYLIVSWYR